uniref:non-specific serine/threonine protein kinase n=1 Tax=Oryza nivara TaxID=4536 RepID=A0A0E0FF93_ORYNI
MAAVSTCCTHHLLPLLLLAAIVATTTTNHAAAAATLNITNLCPFTVWPAAVPVGGGRRLDPGTSWALDVPAGAAPGRVWARTGCTFDATGTNGTCLTGDCGGALSCTGYGEPPQTLAEFSLGQADGQDLFDISLVDGFNVPMDFLPAPPPDQSPPCSKGPRCPANVTAQCPGELRAHGGCNSACRVFKQDKYCCTGNGTNTCEPTTYSLPFVRMCPDAYSYSRNDASSPGFTCPQGKKVIAGIIIASVIGSTSVLTMVMAYTSIKRRTRRRREIHEEEQELEEITLQGMPRRFTFQQLQEATDQFRDKLGEGGFGSVFLGRIGGERVAVKRLDRSGQGMREFLAEVQTIGSIHHINLVRLIGFCAEKSQRLLVYEHMPKGSLDRWIYHQQGVAIVPSVPPLDWQTRHKIITQVAKGLSYLHEECTKRIAHLDVKPQNILLDDKFNAKLSDFGLCKLIDRDKSQVITRMRGTPGYLAPEWLTSQITEKADVYSFGIVVMEIISGRKNVDTSRSEQSIHLITLLQEKVKSDQLVDLIDKDNNDMQVHEQEVKEMMKLAMWCLQIDCKRRPQMSEVIKALEGTISIETNIVHDFVAVNPLWAQLHLLPQIYPDPEHLNIVSVEIAVLANLILCTKMSKVIATTLLLSVISHGAYPAMGSAWEEEDFARNCPPSRCSGSGPEIRFPHQLESSNSSSSSCSASCARLACSGPDTILHHPFLGPCKVTAIDYKKAVFQIIPLVDSLSSCPLEKLIIDNLPEPDYRSRRCSLYNAHPGKIVCCSKALTPSMSPTNDYDGNIADHAVLGPISCLSDPSHFSYLVDAYEDIYSLPLDCKAVSKGIVPISGAVTADGPTFKQLAERILNFAETNVSWSEGGIPDNCVQCEQQGQRCAFSLQRNQTFCMGHKPHGSRVKVIAATSSVAAFVVISLVVATAIYLSLKLRYNEEVHLKVEMFLRTYGTSKPTRYTFSEVKKIARRFKEKVGQGGFGTVYKGKLPNGVPVAVKMLENPTGDGEEFINEVATIGTIHHTNIVRLLGFCSEGTRRALVYELMPNESLEKYIFLRDPNTQELLSPDKMLDIALGIARGMEYLHQGCNQRILHFDIKPHNILLDYNFSPKISDFGLAKLCPRDQSIITLTKARGTMGYIAPELYSRNFGEISYKSDVYSFGMLVLEMVSGRRSWDPSIENQNEVYFPEWIYEKGNDRRRETNGETAGPCGTVVYSVEPKKSALNDKGCKHDNWKVAEHTATLNITNRCSFTVWPAAVPVGGGMRLDPGESWALDVPANSGAGRVWARTGCSFDANGNGSCQTGDCGGVLKCKNSGKPPQTLAEFTVDQTSVQDFFDISLTDGFNVPMDFLPVPAPEQRHGAPPCSKGPRCPANITSQCPSELKAPGGCNSACNVFKQDKYCCTGTTGTKTCEPTTFSLPFVRMCPDAYSYSLDDSSSTTFTCPSGTNYQIIFCPPTDLTSSSPVPPPAPIAIGPSGLDSSSKRGGRLVATIVVSVIGSTSVLTIIIASIIIIKRRIRRHQEMQEEEQEFEELPLQGMPRRFTFQQLQEATDQFRDKLGQGGFGSVFLGQIGGERVAVKRLDQSGQGMREFMAEVQTIGSIHHINLVRLIGFCAEKSQRLLVYEHMPKGSLDRWLYHQQGSPAPALDWWTRYKIITQVAKGLSYLHEECMMRIAHLDVKPQNILLDDNFNAKLSDFGLCKLIDRDKSQVITRMRGTPGYLAPEWLTSQITEKADVYSFGIVVMEMISGRKNLDTSRSEQSIHLITLLQEKVKGDQLADLIDKHSNDMQVHRQEIIEMMKLAMWCLQIDCKRRPQMSEVVKVLEGTTSIETDIDHDFVATNPVSFGVAGIVDSDPPSSSP